MNLSILKIGETVFVPATTVNKLVTEKQFIDPLTFKKIFVDDIVSVKAPSGATDDFRVQNISNNYIVVLGPPQQKAKIDKHLDKMFIMSNNFVNSKSNFRVKKNDLVTLNNKSGKKINMRVDYTIDNKFILLSLVRGKVNGTSCPIKDALEFK